MKKIVAIRHVAFEHLGTIAPFLEQLGFQISYLDIGKEDLATLNPEAPELLVVLGGPIGAYEEKLYPFLIDELKLIERRLAAGLPILGICLGAQLMARALGSRVYPGPVKEIGWYQLSLTPEGERSCLANLKGCAYQVLHWHGDTFDLPANSQRLASSALTENQAFIYGNNALGLQFHLEVDVTEIESWLIGHAHEIAATPGITPSGLRETSASRGKILATSAETCLSQWLTEVGLMQ